MEYLALSIGIGLFVSLVMSEFFGLSLTGMVIPGYLALGLSKPADIIITLSLALLTFLIIRGLSHITILYGERRIILTFLIGYTLSFAGRLLLPVFQDPANITDYHIIGYIIPSLIAAAMDKNGMQRALSNLTITSVLVRFILILILGESLPQ